MCSDVYAARHYTRQINETKSGNILSTSVFIFGLFKTVSHYRMVLCTVCVCVNWKLRLCCRYWRISLLVPALCNQCSLSVSHSVCRITAQSNWSISWKLKLDAMIGPTSRKNLLTYDGDPSPDMEFWISGIPFHFHYWGIGYFRGWLAFIVQSLADFHDTLQHDWRQLAT